MRRERTSFRRATTALFVVLAGVLSFGLYVIKHGVIDLESRLTQINREIARDQKAIHVLKAEWSFLNEPSRLEDMARRHLGMAPSGGGQFGTLIALPARLAPSDIDLSTPALPAVAESKP
ncbi:MAG: hypothetical protein FJX42_01160 [Alphaproteobacteria bacterium]|nr:hypothetical protein [Alphaproteobacteria bacterium]